MEKTFFPKLLFCRKFATSPVLVQFSKLKNPPNHIIVCTLVAMSDPMFIAFSGRGRESKPHMGKGLNTKHRVEVNYTETPECSCTSLGVAL